MWAFHKILIFSLKKALSFNRNIFKQKLFVLRLFFDYSGDPNKVSDMNTLVDS